MTGKQINITLDLFQTRVCNKAAEYDPQTYILIYTSSRISCVISR